MPNKQTQRWGGEGVAFSNEKAKQIVMEERDLYFADFSINFHKFALKMQRTDDSAHALFTRSWERTLSSNL